MKKRLYLAQFQGRYGSNCFLPYSVGLIWSFAKTFPAVTDAYEMCGFLYAKEPIAKAIEKLDRPDLVCLSHYIWNAEYNRAFAKAIKEKWPNCTTLVGGVHVWEESPRTLEENPQFDFGIFGEGEQAFVDFVVEYSKENPNYSKCGSLIWRKTEPLVNTTWEVQRSIKVNQRQPLVDVSKLRSPYLDGVFDSLLPLERSWTGSSETDRGCP